MFDILHAGHLAYFTAARKYGDRLIVSVTTDRFVNKGPGRPYFSTSQRAEMLRSLSLIDEVIISDEPTASGVIHRIRPNFYVKGPDYRSAANDVTGEIFNEKKAVEAHGGQLVFTETETFSSGTLINRFFQKWTNEQRACIEKVKELGGLEACKEAIEEISKLKVLVVGEPILDVYRFVTPEGISSKSPSISAKFLYEEVYEGGSIAIRNHLRGFTEHTQLQAWAAKPVRKVRYIAGTQRVFEVTERDEDFWEKNDSEFFSDKLGEISEKVDLMIIADFGHGMLEGHIKHVIDNLPVWKALNVQTNSSNFGFNVFTKYKKYDYLCLDKREAQLAFNDRLSPTEKLFQKLLLRSESVHSSMTLGPNGASLGTLTHSQATKYGSPAFSDVVVDATGAGDAFFAITSCLVKLGSRPELIPFLGCVFAGLKTKIMGNKSAVTKAQLLKAVEGILK